ncbi:MAG: RimK family alpha-L-glutamate ligase [Candidatus Moraniibacteriota bacterium]
MKKVINFLIIGKEEASCAKDLKKEIIKNNHRVSVVSLGELIFKINTEEFCIKTSKIKDLAEFDVCFFRGYSKNINQAKILAKYLKKRGLIVIDDILTEGFIPGKLSESYKLKKAGLNYPASHLFCNLENVNYLKRDLVFPLVVKPLYGRKGEGVRKIGNIKELKEIIGEQPWDFIVQEYIQADGDIRVIVVNNKIIGAIKRNLVPGDFRSNISLGARVEQIKISTKEKEVALRAAKASGLEIAGVDIIIKKNKRYILEVNPAPVWIGFKKATGINPAEDIVKYAIEKYKKH